MSNAAPHREAILVARKFFLERVDEDCASRRGLAMSDGSLEITYRNFAHGSVLDVRGELDVAHASTLGIAVYHALGAKPKRLVIDLCSVRLVDLRGLAVLLGARRRAIRLGVELKLACDVQSTLGLLALTRLDRDFDVRATRADALSP